MSRGFWILFAIMMSRKIILLAITMSRNGPGCVIFWIIANELIIKIHFISLANEQGIFYPPLYDYSVPKNPPSCDYDVPASSVASTQLMSWTFCFSTQLMSWTFLVCTVFCESLFYRFLVLQYRANEQRRAPKLPGANEQPRYTLKLPFRG